MPKVEIPKHLQTEEWARNAQTWPAVDGLNALYATGKLSKTRKVVCGVQ